MSAEHPTPLLDRVLTPQDLRTLDDHDLPQLAAELRQETIDAVSVTGGHLGAGLGVVELTEADFTWVTEKLMETADKHAGGRIVSLLEGGYDLDALARSTAVHVRALMQASS